MAGLKSGFTVGEALIWRSELMAGEAKATDAQLPQSNGVAGPMRPGAGEDSREMEARGRMLTDYGEHRRQLASLMAEASGLGAQFQELSNQLRMCPNVVSVEGLIPPNSSKPAFAQSLFDTVKLVRLVSQIRQTIARKNEIQERLQDIGILDAYGQFRY